MIHKVSHQRGGKMDAHYREVGEHIAKVCKPGMEPFVIYYGKPGGPYRITIDLWPKKKRS